MAYPESKRLIYETKFPGLTSAAECLNLRHDGGALVSRPGFKTLITAEGQIRGAWYGSSDGTGESRWHYVVGNEVFRLEAGGAAPTGTIGTAEGEVSFYFFAGALYLLDGENIYIIGAAGTAVLAGEIPTVAISYGEGPGRTVAEPNLLNDRVKEVFYLNSSAASVQLTRRAQTVHEVLWNGSNLTGWSLNYGPQGTIVTFAQQIHGISTVEVIYTPLQGAETAALRTKLRRCRQAAVWGGVGASAVLLWGADPNTVFASELKGSSPCGGYFTRDGVFPVGSAHPLRAIVRRGSRALAFTRGECFLLTQKKIGEAADKNGAVLGSRHGYHSSMLNESVGAYRPGGAVMAGRAPVSVDRGGVWLWNASYVAGERDAERITGCPELDDETLSAADLRYDAPHGEIWLYGGGRTLVYSEKRKEWYKYDFCPDFCIDFEGRTAAVFGGTLAVFEDGYCFDGDIPITVGYTGDWQDCGEPMRRKTAAFAAVTLGAGSNAVAAFADGTTEGGDIVSRQIITRAAGDTPVVCRSRIRLGRADHIRLRFSGEAPVKLLSAEIYSTAEEGGENKTRR
ncbi:MAG: hypothetical protein ACOX4O_04880 [Eubacteriales bacterium]|jgi:hypothetical protein